MNSRNGQAGSSASDTFSSKEKPIVNITVSVAQASPAEARKLADMVKSYLEDDALINNMGRR
jgi:hypothetical protein